MTDYQTIVQQPRSCEGIPDHIASRVVMADLFPSIVLVQVLEPNVPT
nr:hypothetical protein [Candidatus Sigynarchaeota archaeon]